MPCKRGAGVVQVQPSATIDDFKIGSTYADATADIGRNAVSNQGIGIDENVGKRTEGTDIAARRQRFVACAVARKVYGSDTVSE